MHTKLKLLTVCWRNVNDKQVNKFIQTEMKEKERKQKPHGMFNQTSTHVY